MQFVGLLAQLNEISSPVWAMSIKGPGIIVEGVAAIQQRMDIALRTTKKSDPLRPEFGSNVYKYADVPDAIAIPNIKREILECLGTWVPDIKVVAVRHKMIEPGHIIFEILFMLLDATLLFALLYDIKNGLVDNSNDAELTLQAVFPLNPDGKRYRFEFKVNGSAVFPLQDPGGFASIADMYEFMQSNYAYMGRWYLLSDRIVCKMKSAGVTSASLFITTIQAGTRLEVNFPVLLTGQNYRAIYEQTGTANIVSPDLPTPSDILLWARETLTDFEWSIQFILSDGTGIFSDEFSDEFSIDVTGYRLIGISETITFSTINISNV